ncbi:hypothetical protein [Rhodococcus wratislaviensis]|uniref:hypothetical protein n=1 Tax=Rhodococcus wratislaviensis TaxID=44752 RepID=UPI0012DE7131|nr:hypothetical protein [Rhodococcus wratislaviensis]
MFAKQTNAVLIHPFDHSDVVAGQASVALEIFDQVPEASTIIAPSVEEVSLRVLHSQRRRFAPTSGSSAFKPNALPLIRYH